MIYHKLFYFNFSFWIWKLRKEEKKLQKFGYLEKEKCFVNEKKAFFIVFKGLSFCAKIKNNGPKP